MANTRLTSEKWKWILEFLRSDPGVYVKDESECRKFIEAIVWINRTGAPWRDLPEKFGKSNSVFRRFTRWKRNGVWERMYLHFIQEPDMENLLIDSTIVRAHPCAAGASAEKGAGRAGVRQKQRQVQHEGSRER